MKFIIRSFKPGTIYIMDLEKLIIYAITIFIATILPGPSIFLAMSHGIRYGVKRAIYTACGVTTAAVIMAVVSAVGLGTMITISGFAFQAIKYLGACYLIYLGIKTWFARAVSSGRNEDTIQKNEISDSALFFQALGVGLGNPKAILFFTALFPQFIGASGERLYGFYVLIITLAFVVFICMIIWSFGGMFITAHLFKGRTVKLINRIMGAVFIGFGTGMLLSD